MIWVQISMLHDVHCHCCTYVTLNKPTLVFGLTRDTNTSLLGESPVYPSQPTSLWRHHLGHLRVDVSLGHFTQMFKGTFKCVFMIRIESWQKVPSDLAWQALFSAPNVKVLSQQTFKSCMHCLHCIRHNWTIHLEFLVTWLMLSPIMTLFLF